MWKKLQIRTIALVAILMIALTPIGAGRAAQTNKHTPLYGLRAEEGIRSLQGLAEVKIEASDEVPQENPVSVNVASACMYSACVSSTCIVSGCVGSICVLSGCVGSMCADPISICTQTSCESACAPSSTCQADSYCMGSNCGGSACPNTSYCASACDGGDYCRRGSPFLPGPIVVEGVYFR